MDPATIGSIVSIAGSLGGLFGKKKKKKGPNQISRLTKEQQELFSNLLGSLQGQGSGPLGSMFGPFDSAQATNVFDQTVRAPAMQKFREQTVPTIAGQFRKGNLGQSASFENALARSGRDIETSLDGQMSQYLQQGEQQSNNQRLNAMMQLLGMNTFDYEKPQTSPFDAFLGSMAPTLGQGFGDFLTGENSPLKSFLGNKGGQAAVSGNLGPIG